MGISKRMDRLEAWRLRLVLPYVRSHLLDIGCGYNNLVRSYGSGVGIDVYRWNGITVQIGDAAALPFSDHCFDTVAVIAALNHIPNREAALKEIWRVLRSNGILLVTMIGPLTGQIAHVFFRQDEEVRGGLGTGELKGISRQRVCQLLNNSDFKVVKQHSFELGFNTLFVAVKSEQEGAL